MATSMVIMMGRSRSERAFLCRISHGFMPRVRSWLMYSTMMTPISTDTPISARNPRPEETLKCVPVSSRLSKSSQGRERDDCENQARPTSRNRTRSRG